MSQVELPVDVTCMSLVDRDEFVVPWIDREKTACRIGRLNDLKINLYS